MSGQSHKGTKFTFEKDGVLLSDQELANSLNTFYISVNADIPPLDMTTLPAYLPSADQVPTIEPYEVCKKLLDLLHTWLSHLDSPGQYLRICFLDFSKAFDRIGHNVLIQNSLLLELGDR